MTWRLGGIYSNYEMWPVYLMFARFWPYFHFYNQKNDHFNCFKKECYPLLILDDVQSVNTSKSPSKGPFCHASNLSMWNNFFNLYSRHKIRIYFVVSRHSRSSPGDSAGKRQWFIFLYIPLYKASEIIGKTFKKP